MNSQQYTPLSEEDFYKIYKKSLDLKKDEFNFITKAYYQKLNVVAVYEEEAEKDCYFQLPSFETGMLPEERKSVYYLPKNKVKELSNSFAPDGLRMNIPISSLIELSDPYATDKTPTNPVRNRNKEVIIEQKEELNLVDKLCKLSKMELLGVLNTVLVRKL